ncbi:hypothetical protein RB595_006563 [Gaeumannomyces hyphopodioides]
MCQGTVTTLLCGHKLSHFSSRCGRGCAEPTSGARERLRDTCAWCHAEHSSAGINDAYDRQREDLTAQLRAAPPGSPQAAALTKLIGRLQVQHMEALARAGRLARRGGAVDVQWPGKADDYEADILAGVPGVHGRNLYVLQTSDSGS